MRFGSRVYVGTYLSSLFIQGFTVLQGMILARMLGPEGRGEFAAIQLWPSIFATLGLLGIHFVLARRSGRGETSFHLIRDSVVVSLVTGILTASICFLSVPYLVPEKNQNLLPYIILFTFFIPLFHIRTNFAAIDQGRGNFELLNLSRVMLYPVFFCGLICTWFFAKDRLLGTVIALLVGNGAVTIFRLIVDGRSRNLGPFNLPSLKLFYDGIPYQVTIFFQLASQYVDQIILLWLLNPVDLAMYVVARSSASIVGSLPASLGLISLSEATRLDRDTGFIPLAKMLRRGGLVVFLLALCLTPLFQWLIPIIYGDEFTPAIALAIYVVVGVIASGFSGMIEESLRGHGIPMSAILPRSVGLILLILIGVTTTPIYGVTAIAIGFSFSQLIVLLFFLKFILSYFNKSQATQLVPQLADFRYLIKKVRKTVGLQW